MDYAQEVVRVEVDGETICQDVYVDRETGLDIDPQSGIFRTRKETEELVRSIYSVGKTSMRSELQRYNEWMCGGKGSVDVSVSRGGQGGRPLTPAVKTPFHRDPLGDGGRLLDKAAGGRLLAPVGGPSGAKASPMAAPNGVNVDEQCAEWREKAAARFASKDYLTALFHYRRVRANIDNPRSLERTAGGRPRRALLAVCLSNAAECNIRLGRFEDGREAAQRSWELDRTSLKTAYRLVTCLVAVGQATGARQRLTEGMALLEAGAADAVVEQWVALEGRVTALVEASGTLPAAAPPPLVEVAQETLTAFYNRFGYFPAAT